MICEACNRQDQPIAGVGCSALGAISMAYCVECAKNNAEPKGLIEFTIDDCGGLENVREEVKNIVTYFEDGKYIPMKEFK